MSEDSLINISSRSDFLLWLDDCWLICSFFFIWILQIKCWLKNSMTPTYLSTQYNSNMHMSYQWGIDTKHMLIFFLGFAYHMFCSSLLLIIYDMMTNFKLKSFQHVFVIVLKFIGISELVCLHKTAAIIPSSDQTIFIWLSACDYIYSVWFSTCKWREWLKYTN